MCPAPRWRTPISTTCLFAAGATMTTALFDATDYCGRLSGRCKNRSCFSFRLSPAPQRCRPTSLRPAKCSHEPCWPTNSGPAASLRPLRSQRQQRVTLGVGPTLRPPWPTPPKMLFPQTVARLLGFERQVRYPINLMVARVKARHTSVLSGKSERCPVGHVTRKASPSPWSREKRHLHAAFACAESGLESLSPTRDPKPAGPPLALGP